MTDSSLTIFHDEDGRAFVNMYRERDGQPEIHGREMAYFFNSFDAIVDGYKPGDRRKLADGMGCLVAQMLSHLKKGVGGYYLQHPDDLNSGQVYVYRVYKNRIEVFVNDRCDFIGNWNEFYQWCHNN